MRHQFITLKALEDTLLQNNQQNGVVIGRVGWLFEDAANLSLRTAQRNILALNNLTAHIDAHITFMLVPMSSAVYPQMLPLGYHCDDQSVIIQGLYADCVGITTIPLFEAMLVADKTEPLYFRTDHHWSAAGMNVGYELLLQAWHLSKKAVVMDAVPSCGGELGSYYAKFPNPFLQPDPFTFAFPRGIILENDGEVMAGLYDADTITTQRDKYAALLYGNHAHTTLLGTGNSGVLLVIKDSYANPLLPLLAQYYQRVEAIDLRYFKEDLYTWIEARPEFTNVLCIYGLTTWLSDRNLARQTVN